MHWNRVNTSGSNIFVSINPKKRDVELFQFSCTEECFQTLEALTTDQWFTSSGYGTPYGYENSMECYWAIEAPGQL